MLSSTTVSTVFVRPAGAPGAAAMISVSKAMPPDGDRATLNSTCEREAVELYQLLQQYLPDATLNKLKELASTPPR